MTAVGKILVFVNLLFSLIVGGFIIMVFIARTNWADGYKKVNEYYKASEADNATLRVAVQDIRAKTSQEIDKLNAEIKKLQDDLAVKDGELRNLNAQLTAEKEKTVIGDASTTAVQEETKRREEEIKRFEAQVKTLNDRLFASIAEQTKLRDRSVAAEIENKTLKERNNQLALKIEEIAKENDRIRNPTATTGGATMTAKNPPLESIEGVITKMDTQSGLLTLSIGSDAGLTKGHTLEVFRLNPAKYLGTVRIVDVTAHEAVARPMARPIGPIQKGDRVASKILGS